ncbi:site-specific integrase [Caproiciproducens sp. CPB-2]|uniref:site-specific integrase n=1 Tax=Caproiciproducens sp. CPB-2 TaxID=3030017 RepID=UPI0023DA29A6|nr:site-specific integrase [Caproiciproducens sp. CPB-2]MDF1493706.1 site-specific integrase [Caproiciproducens sp. CPB-2]
MIERLWIKRASAMWSIDGVRLTMRHLKDISDDEMILAIEKYRNLLKRQSYREENAGLCESFRFFGGISFVKLGSMAFTDDFNEMFRYYARAAVIRWAESEYIIRSKELGAHFVFEEMLRCENDPIHYDYTYIFDEVPGSRRYQEILESEFSAFWSERIEKQMLGGLDLKDITRKIGLLRCAEYAALTDRQTMEAYLRGIAHTFTDRREQISLSKLFGNVYGGTRTSSKLIPCSFDQMMRRVANEEFQLQYEKFPAENHLQLDVHSDQWVLYAQHGPTLRFNKMDFTVIRSASLRMEVKYYLKQRFSGFIQIKDRFLTAVAYGVNFLSSHNRRIHFFSDISECDVKALHIALENRSDEPGEKQWAFSNTMSIFSAMQTVTDYLMGGLRDENIKSPVPQSNPFRAFVFHNSKDYIKNTLIIPESVMNEMDRHMYELCGEYRLLYQILSQTGIRTKEAVFLEDNCLEKTSYDGIFNLRYIPYKVIAARRRHGREDHRRIMITGELAGEIAAQAAKTEALRKEYGLPYIFIDKRKNFKASMINPEYFLVKLDQIAKRYDLRDENGALWHFTARQYRKTLAVTLIENGGTMEELAYLLGHLSPSTSAAYYADVRKKKLAEMNTAFFKTKFELMLSDKQLSRFSEEERRALYVDFYLESRRVEFGHCLKKLSEGGCTSRNSLVNCVNCKNLCTGVRYLPYWRQLHTEQAERLNALLSVYHANGISEYENFPEYKQEKALATGYAGIVRALEGGEA